MNQFQYLLSCSRKWVGAHLARLATQLDPPVGRQSSGATLPRSRVIKATFHFSLPAPATEAEIEEWVKFELDGGMLSGNNALMDRELNLLGQVSLLDLGVHEHLRFVGTARKFKTFSSFRLSPYDGPTSTDIIMNPNHPALQPDDDNA